MTSLTQQAVNNLYSELVKAGVKAVLLAHGFEDTINSLNNGGVSGTSSTYKVDQPFDIPFKLSSSHNPMI